MNVETIGLMLLGLGILVLFAVGLSRPRRKSPLNLRETRPAPAPPPEDEEDLQKELDRIFDKPVPEPPKPKPRRKWVRALGVIARIATYGGIAWAIWTFYPPPKDIFEIPLAELKLGDIACTIFYVMIFLGLGRLFLDFLTRTTTAHGICGKASAWSQPSWGRPAPRSSSANRWAGDTARYMVCAARGSIERNKNWQSGL